MFFAERERLRASNGADPAHHGIFRPLRNIWNRAREYARAAISAAGISWMSRHVYRYPTLMLRNLGARQPATQNWPLYLYPPPHFLIGYQYVVRVCNDYVFETRAYSRLVYRETVRLDQQIVDWSTMANCSYTINAGAYHRFIDLENFDETLRQIQQAVLAERVVADLALIQPLRGFGRTEMADLPPQRRNVPVERFLQEQCMNLGECQDQAWGFANRIRIQQAGRRDLIILTTIRRLRCAYFNFLLSHPPPNRNNTERAAHVLSLPCDCDWLEAFVQRFSDPVDAQSLRFETAASTERVVAHVIDALSLPQPAARPLTELRGGAFELRPRENGRAVTQEMRIRRGEMVQRFIESLPLPTRRRRVARPAPPSPSPSPEPVELEMPPLEGEEEEEEEELPPRSFAEEVRAAVAEVIRLLQEELTVSARNEQFFNFAVDFYEAINMLEREGNINESTIRRWVIYFFIVEHIATTLNYLHHHLRLSPVFARHVELNLGQVVMRARDEDGAVIYSRVWNEPGTNAFSQLMRRISTDLAATVHRAGRGELDEEEIERFMTDIAYRDHSGDVEEIIRQAELNDASINSVDLSFRFKVTGPVAFTQHPEIQRINRRVVQHASDLRQQLQPMPELNDPVQLPPLRPERQRPPLGPRRPL
ncbi:terminal protein [Bovine adenovirus 3]|uniref:Preterminal protein n=1 Tax=Bovine adenovirus B serotype 3 TaxID=10510 RepID=A0A9W3IMP3_ADEB3|nr:terminal protein [Bovine adenovirus 3]